MARNNADSENYRERSCVHYGDRYSRFPLQAARVSHWASREGSCEGARRTVAQAFRFNRGYVERPVRYGTVLYSTPLGVVGLERFIIHVRPLRGHFKRESAELKASNALHILLYLTNYHFFSRTACLGTYL
jgi:hypothetical protein